MLFKKSTLKSNYKVKMRQSVAVVGGKTYEISSPDAKIASTSRRFSNNNMAQPIKGGDTEMMSLEILNTIGVSLVLDTPYTNEDFTLLKVQTDTEIIDNENILDGVSFQKPIKPTDLKDKFKNYQDPIYKLDDTLSISAQNMREKLVKKVQIPQVGDITAKVCTLNEQDPSTSLKYFKTNDILNSSPPFLKNTATAASGYNSSRVFE